MNEVGTAFINNIKGATEQIGFLAEKISIITGKPVTRAPETVGPRGTLQRAKSEAGPRGTLQRAKGKH